MTATYTTQIAFISRFGAFLFIFGKFLRFFLFLGFILLVATKTSALSGYSLWQIILFYATFNLIDTSVQFFFREVYRFRSYVVSGDFDYFLTKPISPLFRALFGGSDILDLPMFVASIILTIISINNLGGLTFAGLALYFILIGCGLIIAFAFHAAVLAIGVLTTEVDNTIMMYRDLTSMGRFPVDIYREPLRTIITFVIPVGIMMTFPAKALIGIFSPFLVLFALIISSVFLASSLKFWQYALKNYTSASS